MPTLPQHREEWGTGKDNGVEPYSKNNTEKIKA